MRCTRCFKNDGMDVVPEIILKHTVRFMEPAVPNRVFSGVFFGHPCGEPAISHDSHHVSLVQWTTCLLPATRVTGSNPLGGTYVKQGFSC